MRLTRKAERWTYTKTTTSQINDIKTHKDMVKTQTRQTITDTTKCDPQLSILEWFWTAQTQHDHISKIQAIKGQLRLNRPQIHNAGPQRTARNQQIRRRLLPQENLHRTIRCHSPPAHKDSNRVYRLASQRIDKQHSERSKQQQNHRNLRGYPRMFHHPKLSNRSEHMPLHHTGLAKQQIHHTRVRNTIPYNTATQRMSRREFIQSLHQHERTQKLPSHNNKYQRTKGSPKISTTQQISKLHTLSTTTTTTTTQQQQQQHNYDKRTDSINDTITYRQL